MQKSKENCQQVSGFDIDGNPTLSVFVKQTFDINRWGNFRISANQIPIFDEPAVCDDYSDMLLHDTDLFPLKAATDVVIKGHVYDFDGNNRVGAIANINGTEKRILVYGERKCHLNQQGKIIFSKAEPIEKIALSYLNAYGGRDSIAEKEYGNVVQDIFDYGTYEGCTDYSMSSPFVYPRNPYGKGYLIEKSSKQIDELELPNLEDPNYLLTPDNLALNNPTFWAEMPLPQATDWLNYSWFPRIALLGVIPPMFKKEGFILEEVKLGYLPENILEPNGLDLSPVTTTRLSCGASPGLQVPYLKGGEPIKLVHMHPEVHEWRFKLPHKVPKIWTDGRNGKLNETTPVIHTLVIEPDNFRITILWRGTSEALRPYHPDELKKMPFDVKFPV